MALDRPCGTWKCAPIGRLMPCTSATDAFEKAMPAWVAPSIICSRAARFDGSKQAVRRLAPIRCIAANAMLSEYGLRLRLAHASRAGVKPSMPGSGSDARRVGEDWLRTV